MSSHKSSLMAAGNKQHGFALQRFIYSSELYDRAVRFQKTCKNKGKTMRAKIAFFALALGLGSGPVLADLEIYKDYDISDGFWSVQTVKVKSNMIDAYLEGIKKTWMSGCATSKALGQVEGCKIFVSDLPDSGDFNVLLVTIFKNDEMAAPNKARYDEWVAKFGAAQVKSTTEQAQRDYPAMREITGDYRLRELTLK